MFDFIYEILFNVCWGGLMVIIQLLWDLLVWLCGGTPSTWFNSFVLRADNATGSNNLLYNLINNPATRTVFFAMVAVAGSLIVITILIAMIRTEMSADDSVKSKKKLMVSTFKACLITLILPILFTFSVALVGSMVDMLTASMDTSGTTINDLLIYIGFGDNIEPQAEDEFAKINWIGNWNISSGQFRTVFPSEIVGALNPLKAFNWLLIIIIGLACIVFLAIAVVPLVERLIVITLLTIVSPIVLAIYPLDDGNRFGIWKDLFISKMISALALILCLQIYIILVSVVNSMVSAGFLGSVVKVAIMLIGLFVFNKGASILANLVGYSTGLAEGQSQMSTMAAVRTLMMGGKALSKTLSLRSAEGGQGAGSSIQSLANAVQTAFGGGSKGGSDGGQGSARQGQEMQKGTNISNSLSNIAGIGSPGHGSGGAADGIASVVGKAVGAADMASKAAGKLAEGQKNSIMTPASNIPTDNKTTGKVGGIGKSLQDKSAFDGKLPTYDGQRDVAGREGLGNNSNPINVNGSGDNLMQNNLQKTQAAQNIPSIEKRGKAIEAGESGIAKSGNNKTDNSGDEAK